MRIVHVSDCYLPRTGGIESQVSDLAAHQGARGHEVHVLTATPEAERIAAVGGVAVHRIGTAMPFELPVDPRAPRHVRALLRELRPDVVHVHAGVVSPFAHAGARVALAEGYPTAITWHCMLDGAVRLLRLAVGASRWRSADAALSAVSTVAARRVAAAFRADVAVVPNGIDLERWAPLPSRPRRGGPRPVRAVAASRFAPRKRVGALVDVAAGAAERLPRGSVHLTVFGAGPARRRVVSRVASCGVADLVALPGRVPRGVLRDACGDADVFLAPASLESFGLAALEARTAGLAVLARRGTGIEEFVADGAEGFLVDDDRAMAEALVRLVREPGLLATIRSHNRDVRPRFGWDEVLDTVDAEYRRAAALGTVEARAAL